MYLDNNATTPIDPAVRAAVIEALDLYNPSSIHRYGQAAKQALIEARSAVATFFKVPAEAITFTSSGTEAMNLLIRGLYRGGPLVTTEIEHSCVAETVTSLTDAPIYLPVDDYGAPRNWDIIPQGALVVLSAVNSETGVMVDIDALAALDATIILDGVAWLGKEPVTLPQSIAAIGFSGHKIHGPKGIGCAISRLPLLPMITGGGQESGRRAGTENLPCIIGFAKALELIPSSHNMGELRDHFESLLMEALPVERNGGGPRVCNTSNLFFPGVDAESLLIALDMVGVAASAGSACSSGALEPSRVLLSMGYPRERALSSLRFSLSRLTTKEEVESAAAIIIEKAKSF